MGASLTMIDRHYGHLARDGREHAIVELLDALNTPASEPWTLVDARWTPNQRPARGRRREKRPLSRQETQAL
jgi:hypothetical protein